MCLHINIDLKDDYYDYIFESCDEYIKFYKHNADYFNNVCIQISKCMIL